MSKPDLKLVIANKGYSSWSMRPWMVLKHFDIPFSEVVIPLYLEGSREELLRLSPTGKAPALIAGALTVWDSLAIIEYLAELCPESAIWPKDPAARAHARAVSAEMHSSFQALRQQCPMNFFRTPAPRNFTKETLADIVRIDAIWEESRSRFGRSGPFLFGEFCAADAIYAPVVNRFETYCAPVSEIAKSYMASVQSTLAWQAWAEGAQRETWRIERYRDGD